MATSQEVKDQIDEAVTDKPAGTVLRSQTGPAIKAVVDYVDQQLPYKTYTIALFASGTDNPTVVRTYQNGIGDIVWTRTGIGQYRGTLNGAFPNDKVFFLNSKILFAYDGDTVSGTIHQGNDIDYFTLTVRDNAGALIDGFSCFLEIRVYN